MLALINAQKLSGFFSSTPEHIAWPFVAGLEIDLRPEDRRNNTLIVDHGFSGRERYGINKRSICVHTLIRSVQMCVGDVHAHVEIVGDVPLGAGADLIEREVWTTAAGVAACN